MIQPAASAGPTPLEVAWDGGVVRGYVWHGDANLALLIHAPGHDLDAWANLPETLAAEGYTVLAVDLPGHGLSDDPWEPDRLPDLLTTLVAHARQRGHTRCLVVAAGDSARHALTVPGVDALAALSPTAPAAPAPGPTPPLLVMAGGEDREAAAGANAFFRASRGWSVSSTFGTTAQGTDLLRSPWSAHVMEQIASFLRDSRMPAPAG